MDIDINNLPEEITVEMYAYYNTEFNFISYRDNNDVRNSAMVLMSEGVSMTFKTANKGAITKQAVDNLKAESQKIRADAEVKCKRIDDKINSLLAIEND